MFWVMSNGQTVANRLHLLAFSDHSSQSTHIPTLVSLLPLAVNSYIPIIREGGLLQCWGVRESCCASDSWFWPLCSYSAMFPNTIWRANLKIMSWILTLMAKMLFTFGPLKSPTKKKIKKKINKLPVCAYYLCLLSLFLLNPNVQFHLMMNFFWVYPTLGLFGSFRNQLMIERSGWMITWISQSQLTCIFWKMLFE